MTGIFAFLTAYATTLAVKPVISPLEVLTMYGGRKFQRGHRSEDKLIFGLKEEGIG